MNFERLKIKCEPYFNIHVQKMLNVLSTYVSWRKNKKISGRSNFFLVCVIRQDYILSAVYSSTLVALPIFIKNKSHYFECGEKS